MGLHGEMGVRRSGYESSRRFSAANDGDAGGGFSKDESAAHSRCVMVNGLGSTTVLELLIVAGQGCDFLDRHSVPVAYQTVGQFATSLDMAGFLFSITEVDHELEPLLSAPCRSLCFTDLETR